MMYKPGRHFRKGTLGTRSKSELDSAYEAKDVLDVVRPDNFETGANARTRVIRWLLNIGTKDQSHKRVIISLMR